MFFIKAETQGFGFFVAGKPCAGGMVEENLRLFSISLFAFPFLLFPALSAFPALLSLFIRFSFSFLSFCPSFSRSFRLSLSLSFLSVLLFPALFLFPTLLSLFFSFLFPFFLPFFFPLFSSFPLCFPSFPSFCPSFFRSFPLSHFVLPLFFVSLSLLSVLLFPVLSIFSALLFAYKIPLLL